MAWVTQMAYPKRGCVQGARYCAPTGAGQFFIATYCTLLHLIARYGSRLHQRSWRLPYLCRVISG